ncbi:MAG: leucine-rich repeat protein [Lachnospiraceae bacterium]|nr:leucine-rich repeat protein [Lachnospiraceae bacterium]
MRKSFFKKALSGVLSAAMVITSITVPQVIDSKVAGAEETEDAGSEDRNSVTYDIKSYKNLTALRDSLGTLTQGTDYIINLNSDIDMTDYDWLPIDVSVDGISKLTVDNVGDYDYPSITFNGNGHTIKGMSVNFTEDDQTLRYDKKKYGIGLFGDIIYTDMTVKDLTIDGAKIVADGDVNKFIPNTYTSSGTTNDNRDYSSKVPYTGLEAGALVGYFDAGAFILDNCTVSNSNISGVRKAGGFCGDISSSLRSELEMSITNCKVSDTAVNGVQGVGGFAGSITSRNGYVTIKNNSVEGKKDVTCSNTEIELAGEKAVEKYNEENEKNANSISYRRTTGGGSGQPVGTGGMFGFINIIDANSNSNAEEGLVYDNPVADIRNLTCSVNVYDNEISDKRNYVGGIFGQVTGPVSNDPNLVITDVTNNGGKVEGSYNVGGIVGYTNLIIQGASNNSEVTGSDRVGGIAGANSGTITPGTTEDGELIPVENTGSITGDLRVGGIAGENTSKGIVSGTTNKGDVTGELNVGGIVGLNGGKIVDAIDVEDEVIASTVNTGKVTGVNDGESDTLNGDNIGGIAGNNTGTVDNTTNKGEVKADGSNVGGNVGWNQNEGVVTNPENTANVTGKENVGGNIGLNDGTCTVAGDGSVSNTGDVTGKPDETEDGVTEGGNNVGGNVGHNTVHATVDNPENTGNVKGTENVGGNVGLNEGAVNGAVNGTEGKDDGKVDGDTNVGGNVGHNTDSGEVKTAENNGDVTGEENTGGNIGLNEGMASDLTNKGNSTGENNTGGNVGNNASGSSVSDAANTGKVTGKDNTGGNIGDNDGNAEELTNSGDVEGEENTGGNIGNNDENGVVNDAVNNGDVSGDNNTGGNIGNNDGEANGVVNNGDVAGDPDGTNTGGNIGNNSETGVVDGAVNNGEVTGGDNVGGNIGNDEGTSSNLTDNYKDTSDSDYDNRDIGQLIVDPSNPDTWDAELFGMQIKVNPPSAGAVYLVRSDNATVTLKTVPALGYKFKKWRTTGTKPTEAVEDEATFEINKGAVIVANFEVGVEDTPKYDYKEAENTAETEDGYIIADMESNIYVTADGLTIKVKPASGGSVGLIALDDEANMVTVKATANDGFVFETWDANDKITIASGEAVESNIITFTYSKGAELVAKFAEKPEEPEETEAPEETAAAEETEAAAEETDAAAEETSAATPEATEVPEETEAATEAPEETEAATDAPKETEEAEVTSKPFKPTAPPSSKPASKPAVNPASRGAATKGAVTSAAVSLFPTGSSVTIGNYIYQIIRFDYVGSTLNTVAVIGTTTKELTSVEAFDEVSSRGAVFKVVQIGNKAFKGMTKATKAKVGKNVKKIGNGAFAGCNKAKTLTITSKKLKKIGNNAFKNMKSLKKLVLKSKKLKNVGKNMIKGDKKLKLVKIKSLKLKKVGKKAFTKGAGKKLKIFVPKKKFKKYKKLIKKSKSKKVVVKKF